MAVIGARLPLILQCIVVSLRACLDPSGAVNARAPALTESQRTTLQARQDHVIVNDSYGDASLL